MQKEFNEILEDIEFVKAELTEISDNTAGTDLHYLVARLNHVLLNFNEIGAALEDYNLI